MSALTFVLVHGSWQDGEDFAETIAALERLGHRGYAPTLAGHGPDANRNVTHADCVQSLVDFVAQKGLRDFVLVGHSFGGTVIAKAAEFMPTLVRRLVFWNAFVPLDGECLLDNVPPEYRALFRASAEASPDNTVTLPLQVWREAFINDADAALAEATHARLHPEPFAPFEARLDLKAFHALPIPRSYLNAKEDFALPPGEWAWHPRQSSRLGQFRLVEISGSHEVLFTNPAGLAAGLVDAGRD